jgi:hypothetical protein
LGRRLCLEVFLFYETVRSNQLGNEWRRVHRGSSCFAPSIIVACGRIAARAQQVARMSAERYAGSGGNGPRMSHRSSRLRLPSPGCNSRVISAKRGHRGACLSTRSSPGRRKSGAVIQTFPTRAGLLSWSLLPTLQCGLSRPRR